MHLKRVPPDEVAAEAHQLGFANEPHLSIPESDRYFGSTVVVLQTPAIDRVGRVATVTVSPDEA